MVLDVLLFGWVLTRVPVTSLRTVSMVTPPLAVLLGAFFAGETLTPWALLGGLFVLLGVGLILWKSAQPVTVAKLSVEAKS